MSPCGGLRACLRLSRLTAEKQIIVVDVDTHGWIPNHQVTLEQKVTLLVDGFTRCNGPTTVTPSTDILAQVAQAVILLSINIYILFSVGAAVGGVPAAD